MVLVLGVDSLNPPVKEGDHKAWCTVLIAALGSWEKTVAPWFPTSIFIL
jgi:hypothetical protein